MIGLGKVVVFFPLYQQTFQVINKKLDFPWFYLCEWQIHINLFSIKIILTTINLIPL
tara:strand:- start:1236 stop:1406 length:171 start_codon:yes stop_codon:yes gene_type:complete